MTTKFPVRVSITKDPLGSSRVRGIDCAAALLCRVGFLALFAIVSLSMGVKANASQLREVELEWALVPDATAYELKLEPVNAKSVEPIQVKQKSTLWKGKLVPGIYRMRLRSYDDRGVPGPWDEAVEFKVSFSEINRLEPQANQNIQAQRPDRQSVSFRWKATPRLDHYLLTVLNEKGEVVFKETVRGSQKEVSLPVAARYQWKVEVANDRGLGTEKSEPQPFTLLGPRLDKPVYPISSILSSQNIFWEKDPKAQNFDLDLIHMDEKNQKRTVAREKGLKQNRLPKTIQLKDGVYRLRVRAHGELRASSPVATLPFVVVDGRVFDWEKGQKEWAQKMEAIRNPTAARNRELRLSLEKTTPYYLILSYMATAMDFESMVHEKQATPFKITSEWAGTGRLGLGYQPLSRPWGAFGIVDLSGMNLTNEEGTQSTQPTFFSAELHATYSIPVFSKHKIKLSGGLFTKEMLVLEPEAGTENGFAVEKLDVMGVHLGGQWQYPLTKSMGMYTSLRTYYGMSASKTPNDKEFIPSLFYQFQLLGSLKLTKLITGFAGYSYRVDQGRYESANRDDDPNYLVPSGTTKENETVLRGHYLNLILEVSF